MKLLLVAILLSGCSGAIHAENDLFSSFFNKNNDSYFTHGTKFSYFEETPNERKKETYSLGQNIYTPSDTRENAPRSSLLSSRPYSGYLYLEYRNSIREENSEFIWGLSVGCVGPCSLAKETQQEFHRLINQRVPSWDPEFTQRSEAGAILELEKYYDLASTNLFRSVVYGLGKVGNIITSASGGVDFYFGYGDKLNTPPIIFKVPKEPPSPYTAYLFGKLEERVVPYNHLLEGSLFQEEKHTVDTELLVSQGDLGFVIGYDNFKFTYRYTVFSDEWEEQNSSFAFGGIDIAW